MGLLSSILPRAVAANSTVDCNCIKIIILQFCMCFHPSTLPPAISKRLTSLAASTHGLIIHPSASTSFSMNMYVRERKPTAREELTCFVVPKTTETQNAPYQRRPAVRIPSYLNHSHPGPKFHHCFFVSALIVGEPSSVLHFTKFCGPFSSSSFSFLF